MSSTISILYDPMASPNIQWVCRRIEEMFVQTGNSPPLSIRLEYRGRIRRKLILHIDVDHMRDGSSPEVLKKALERNINDRRALCVY